jgi:hypothetical protein
VARFLPAQTTWFAHAIRTITYAASGKVNRSILDSSRQGAFSLGNRLAHPLRYHSGEGDLRRQRSWLRI